ncbi:MAG: HEAT repeat domain-containing protein [Treponema sp.]|nr:HEAT repeat domain-containing protein [Treponema sp.]MCL2272290.1 HEAT repeat domain-containing protein [Treponema sp.]
MFTLRRFLVLLTVSVILISNVPAQSNPSMTIEESYLQESIELMIIRETARASSREQKFIALEYISDAINRGNKSDDIRLTLDFLSREGRRSVARENNRVVNNFPDVRRQSARYLGQLGTEEARRSLLDICQFENEPMVLQEAIKSLGDIGSNENNETVVIISWAFSKFDNLNPDNLMAIATIDAFEKIAQRNNGISSPEAIRTLVRISEGHYITPVKDRAKSLLAELRGYGN